MEEDILASIPTEGQETESPFGELDTQETETSEESLPEENETEEAPSSQGAEDEETEEPTPVAESNTETEEVIPFNKDPKVQNYIERQVDNRLADALEGLQKGIVEAVKPPVVPEETIPQEWLDLYSTGIPEQDRKNWQTAQAYETKKEQALEARILEKMRTEGQTEQNQVTQARTLIDSQITEMKGEGLTFDENALQKFLVEHNTKFGAIPRTPHPDYPEGLIDLRKGLELMQMVKGATTKPTSEARKKIAAQVGSEKNMVDPDKQETRSVSEMSWDQIVEGN